MWLKPWPQSLRLSIANNGEDDDKDAGVNVVVISADSEHNDDEEEEKDDDDDEIPCEERIPRSRISWLHGVNLFGWR